MTGLFTSLKRRFKIDVLREAGRQYPVFCFLMLSLVSLTVLLNSYIHVLMVFWSFLAGVATFYCSIGPQTLLPSIFFSIKAKKQEQQQELFPLGSSCAVCGKLKCKRHRPTLLLENHQPWLGLKHSKVDASVAEVFDLVLENFVYPWYRDITDDEACIDELRMTFRFFASVLLRRAQKVDVPAVCADKVLKAALKHVEIIARARDKVASAEGLQQAALEEYGADLHVALRSRRHERLYLRRLTEMLFPFLMPPKATECRSLALLLREVMTGAVLLPTLDFMADPPLLAGRVLTLEVHRRGPQEGVGEWRRRPSVLQRTPLMAAVAPQVLKLELKDIRAQQDLLFRFMSFLKREGAVHVLQFLLTVEEFNDRILQPELSEGELQRLHAEVLHIYRTYCLDQSADKINFDRFILEEIRSVAEGPGRDVVKLQTMRCLFEAYEHVLALLERVFTPMFCHSDEYFRHLLMGAEGPARSSRSSRPRVPPRDRNWSRRGDALAISRIGSRIKGVFRSAAVEGAVPPPSGPSHPDQDPVEEAAAVVEDDGPAEPASEAGRQRNLAAWSVAIPDVRSYDDELKRDKVLVFCIRVERNDRTQAGHQAERWTVYRRYPEFYVLESRLTQFHGTFEDAQLPSRRLIGPKNQEFLVSKREEFQEYLQQRLLQHPELSNSQLLADFLSPHSEESQFLDRTLVDVSLGRIFKSVPGKLMKEKGQNLEPFIQSFFNSCESPKPKPSRPELTVLSPSALSDRKLFNDLFKNNAGTPDGPDRKRTCATFMQVAPVDGVYDSMMFMARTVFRVPAWLHHVLAAGRILLKNTLEAYMQQHMRSKLEQVLQEHRLVSLITQLRDAVFCEGGAQRSLQERHARARQTFQEMLRYLPEWLVRGLGEEGNSQGIRLLFEGLQQPLLNKQMTYVLLDLAVQELFPELSKV
uniref:Sorting nexin 14 n=1 Tax=Tetraodon nigroviridis TaxID=99883 RepID=H3CAW1_TETNG